MRYRSCDSCKFLGEREWGSIPARGEIPEIKIRQGICYAAPPTTTAVNQSQFPPVNLGQRCGFHAFSLRGWGRAVKRLFTKEE